MFAETMEMRLVEDFDGAEIIELNAMDVDEVSGAILPFVIPLGVKVGLAIAGTGAAGAGAGYLAGYWANRN